MKKIITILLIVSVLLSLCSCSQVPDNNTNGSNYSNQTTAPTTKIVEQNEPIYIDVSEKVSISNVCDFYVERINISYEVKPPQPQSFYTYYTADDGKKYIDVCVSYKNTSQREKRASEIATAKMICNDQYEYTAFSAIEENNRGDFTYTNITTIDPLMTEYLHYIFEIPEELSKSGTTFKITLSFSGTETDYILSRVIN